MAHWTTRNDNSTRKGVYTSNFGTAIFFGVFGFLLGMLMSLLSMSSVRYSDSEKNYLLRKGKQYGTGVASSVWAFIISIIIIVNGIRQPVNIGMIVGGTMLVAAGIALIVLFVNKYKKLYRTIEDINE